MLIEGCAAVVIGGLGGIGKACCQALLDRGARVVCADVVQADDQVAAWRSRYGDDYVIYAKCDVTSDDDIHGAFKAAELSLGRPATIVINVAAIIAEHQWQQCVDINLNGCIRTLMAAFQHMGDSSGGPGGVVILCSSIAGLSPHAVVPVYSATKAALITLVRAFADPLHSAKHKVRVNTVCPTVVDTPMLDAQHHSGAMYHSESFLQVASTLERLSPAYVAEGILRLVEEDSLNGQVMRISKQQGIDFATFAPQPMN